MTDSLQLACRIDTYILFQQNQYIIPTTIEMPYYQQKRHLLTFAEKISKMIALLGIYWVATFIDAAIFVLPVERANMVEKIVT